MTKLTNTNPGQLTDVHDMVVVHRAFRRELALAPRLVREVAPGDVARAQVIAAHLRLALTGLHLHHTGEDVLLWPKLLERAAPSADLVHRMEAQHHRVEDVVDQLPEALDRWEAEARPAVGEEVAATIDQLREALVEHLDDEELHILPLAARHLTPTEWAALGQHGTSEMEKADLPILFGMVLEDATPQERAAMLSGLPVLVRLVLRTVGAWQYSRYVHTVRGS
ncbi:MAG TPA: hemerythrin domain-containing protein [Microlunatus sp.]